MVVLDGASLTIDSLAAVAEGGDEVVLAPAARDRMAAAREIVDEALRSEAAVYGLTTALAERKSVVLDAGARQGFSRFLIRGHLIAQGPPAPPPVVRAAMVCLVNGFAKGVAGVRPELAEMMVHALNRGLVPAVRRLGSVGQADLGPMADLAEGLLNETGFVLADNEGLALVNNNAFATGWAALAELAAERLLGEAEVAAALDLEAFAGNLSILHPVVTEARPHPGTAATIRRLRALLAGSSLFEPGNARNLQDPLTFRSIPQILGAARDALGYARATIETELNSAGCNPAVVLAERRIVSVGNLDIVPVAAALDFARIALATVVTCAAERTVKLLQSPLSGLPAGLAAEPDTGEEALAEFGWRRAGDRGGGTHARPPGLLRGRELEQGGRDRGPHDDGPALGETAGRHGRPRRTGRRPRAPGRRPGHRPAPALPPGRGDRTGASPRARACRLHRPRAGPARGAGAARRCGPGGPLRPGRPPRPVTGHRASGRPPLPRRMAPATFRNRLRG